ncbi:MAG: hypothetical protein ACXABI_06520 [Candidatus Hodarchaeales archaeon]|jgi:hypothetical protein
MSLVNKCEMCGSTIEKNSIFCPACGAEVSSSSSSTSDIASLKKEAKKQLILDRFDLPQRSFSRLNADQQSQVGYYIALVAGLLIIMFSIAILAPDSTTEVFSIGFTLMGLSVTFLRARHSSRHRSFFAAIAFAILTIGIGLLFPADIDMVLPVGFLLVSLTLTYYYSLRFPESRFLFYAFVLALLTIGLALLFPDGINDLFPAGFMAVGLTVTYHFSRRSSRDRELFYALALAVVTFGIGFLNSDITGTILALGAIAEALILISWAYGRISRPPRAPLNS